MENKADVKYMQYVLAPYCPIDIPKLKIKSKYAKAIIDASCFKPFNIIKPQDE